MQFGIYTAIVIFIWLLPLISGVPSNDSGYTAMGALFSALALAALIMTLHKQHLDSVDAENRHREDLKALASQIEIQQITLMTSSIGTMTNTFTNIGSHLRQQLVELNQSEDLRIKNAATEFEKNIGKLKEIVKDDIANYSDSHLIAHIDRVNNALKNIIDEKNDRTPQIIATEQALGSMNVELMKAAKNLGLLYNIMIADQKGEGVKEPKEFLAAVKLINQIE